MKLTHPLLLPNLCSLPAALGRCAAGAGECARVGRLGEPRLPRCLLSRRRQECAQGTIVGGVLSVDSSVACLDFCLPLYSCIYSCLPLYFCMYFNVAHVGLELVHINRRSEPVLFLCVVSLSTNGFPTLPFDSFRLLRVLSKIGEAFFLILFTAESHLSCCCYVFCKSAVN